MFVLTTFWTDNANAQVINTNLQVFILNFILTSKRNSLVKFIKVQTLTKGAYKDKILNIVFSIFQMRKHQQHVEDILSSRNVNFEKVDIADPNNEEQKQFMRENAKPTTNQKTPLPPQLFAADEYLGVRSIDCCLPFIYLMSMYQHLLKCLLVV